MSSPRVEKSTSSGEPSGRPVQWSYVGDNRIETNGLSWSDQGETSNDSETKRIDLHRLIAALPAATGQPNVYEVLHVEDDDKGSEQKVPSIRLQSITARDLPKDFIDDFWPAKDSYFSSVLDIQDSVAKLHIVVSIGSGTGKAKEFWENVLQPLLQHAQPSERIYDVHLTKSEHSITELTHEVFLPAAQAGIEQAIVLLSGDGGIVDIVNALLSEQPTPHYRRPNIALLPVGTGNALANSTGILADKTTGLATLIRGHPNELPLFRATFSPGARYLVNEAREERTLPIVDNLPTTYGAVVCSWGLHAGLVADSDTIEYRKFGAERFKMAAKEALFPSDGSLPHGYRGKVSIKKAPSEDSTWTEIPRNEHGYVLSTLVSHLEAGFNISPDSTPFDGKLRLVHFGPLSGNEAMAAMGGAYQGGKHVQDERVGYEQIDALRIDFDESEPRWRRVCVDGKIIRVEQGGWVEVRMDVKPVVDLLSLQQ